MSECKPHPHEAVHEIARKVLDIEMQNLNLLVAKFFVENPTLKVDEVEMVRKVDGTGITFSVRKRKVENGPEA